MSEILRMDRVHQRHRDLMKRDGVTWHTHPDDPTRGMWVSPGWMPDWELGYPVFPMTKEPNAR